MRVRLRPSACCALAANEHIVNRVSTICGFVGELGLPVHIKNIQIINLEERERERIITTDLRIYRLGENCSSE